MDYAKKLADALAKAPAKPPRAYCLWVYKIDDQPGHTRMGLMTETLLEATQQLKKIYTNQLITDIHKRKEPCIA